MRQVIDTHEWLRFAANGWGSEHAEILGLRGRAIFFCTGFLRNPTGLKIVVLREKIEPKHLR